MRGFALSEKATRDFSCAFAVCASGGAFGSPERRRDTYFERLHDRTSLKMARSSALAACVWLLPALAAAAAAAATTRGETAVAFQRTVVSHSPLVVLDGGDGSTASCTARTVEEEEEDDSVDLTTPPFGACALGTGDGGAPIRGDRFVFVCFCLSV